MLTSALRRPKASFSHEQAPLVWTIVAWIIGLLVFFPVLYIVLTGLKTEATAITLPPKLIFRPTLDQYREIRGLGFFPFFRNSIVASLVSTLIVVILAVPAAYALALRPMKKWKDLLFFFISTKFMPPAGIVVPIYIIYKNLNLLNTIQGLVIIYIAMNLPIAIWVLRSFFEEVPKDVIDAARLDGATPLQEIFQVIVPMIRPGIVATGFICMIFAWNEFFLAAFLAAVGNSTVPIFMLQYVTGEGLFWAKLSAAVTIGVLPIVLLGWLAQGQLVRGLSLGAVK